VDVGAPSDAALVFHYFCMMMEERLTSQAGSRGAIVRASDKGGGGGFVASHVFVGMHVPGSSTAAAWRHDGVHFAQAVCV
jgi:hypothetical protein